MFLGAIPPKKYDTSSVVLLRKNTRPTGNIFCEFVMFFSLRFFFFFFFFFVLATPVVV